MRDDVRLMEVDMAEVDEPPRGFQVSTSEAGDLQIRYRTTGMGCVVVFLTVWLSGWTVGCLLFTCVGIFKLDGNGWLILLFLVPFWMIDVAIFSFVAWYVRSITIFQFGPEELVIERSLMWMRRRRNFPRTELKEVKQVKDGGEGEDSFPSWGLALIAGTEVHVLSRQPIDKSDWLGPIIAKWADLTFEPAKERKREKYETL